jgi:flagellar biosynthesis protein FlhF
MKIKKFVAASVREGMEQVRGAMGSDAVILESRKVRQRGVTGLFLPKRIEITAALDSVQQRPEAVPLPIADKTHRLEQDIIELKGMVDRLLKKQNNGTGLLSSNLMDRLLENDIDSELAAGMVRSMEDVTGGAAVTSEVMAALLKNKVKDMLLTAQIPHQARVITFVGPTGVGKTTTLAKLAAHYTFERGKTAGIITVDTYRIGAVEQLKTYAAITGIPVSVVYTPQDMRKAIAGFADKDIILVDTTGRSAKNAMQISETAVFLKLLPKGVTFLVVSAGTKPRDLKKIADSFRRLNYDHLIFTKLDETESGGVMLNLCSYTMMPVVYITTGQNVPDDIEAAHPEKLAEYVLGGGWRG